LATNQSHLIIVYEANDQNSNIKSLLLGNSIEKLYRNQKIQNPSAFVYFLSFISILPNNFLFKFGLFPSLIVGFIFHVDIFANYVI